MSKKAPNIKPKNIKKPNPSPESPLVIKYRKVTENPDGVEPCPKLSKNAKDCWDCKNRDGEVHKLKGKIIKVFCSRKKEK